MFLKSLNAQMKDRQDNEEVGLEQENGEGNCQDERSGHLSRLLKEKEEENFCLWNVKREHLPPRRFLSFPSLPKKIAHKYFSSPLKKKSVAFEAPEKVSRLSRL